MAVKGSSSDAAADEVACDAAVGAAAVLVDAASHGGSATATATGASASGVVAGEIAVDGTVVALGDAAAAASDAPHHLLPVVTI